VGKACPAKGGGLWIDAQAAIQSVPTVVPRVHIRRRIRADEFNPPYGPIFFVVDKFV
jgi:hypothetical protein